MRCRFIFLILLFVSSSCMAMKKKHKKRCSREEIKMLIEAKQGELSRLYEQYLRSEPLDTEAGDFVDRYNELMAIKYRENMVVVEVKE